MASIRYTINGKEFGSQTELVDYVRKIIGRYPVGTALNDADSAFMLDLLQRHPEAKQKIGSGVVSIFIAENPVYPGERARGFWLRRRDGSKTDFSYRECIRPATPEKKALSALRAAIEPDTIAFKQAVFDRSPDGLVRCPDTGEWLTFTTSHVDHKAPKTFDKLARQFLQAFGLSFADVAVVPSSDGKIGDRMADETLRSLWVRYHNENAILEIVSAKANLSLRKKK